MADTISRPRTEPTEEIEDQIIVSDDDSGAESDDEAQSPPDGYFHQRQHGSRRDHVQTPYMSNPSTALMDAKSREAAEEQRARLAATRAASGSHTVQPPSRPSSAGSNVSSILTPTSPRARSPVRWPTGEQAPLLDHGPAPPSYSDATAGRDLNLEQGAVVDEAHERSQHEQSSLQQPGTHRAVNYGSFGTATAGAQHDHHHHQHHHHPEHTRDHSHSHSRSHSDEHRHHHHHHHHAGQHVPPGPHGVPAGSNGPFGSRGPFGEHGVFGSHGPLGEHGPIFGRFMPQSMQDGRNVSRGRRGRRSRWDRSHEWRNGFHRQESHKKDDGRRRFCCSFRMFCHLLLAVAIILLLVVIAQITYLSNRGGSKGSGDPNQALPITDPHGKNPTMGPPSDPHLQHPNTNHCKFVHSSNYYVEQFNLRDMQQANFTIIELIERSRHVNGGVTGTLTIVPVKESEKFDISIVAHMATTAAWKVKGFDIIATDTVFEVREPAFERTGGSQQDPACLDVAIKVYVRKGAVLDNFHVSTLNLGIASEGALFQHGTSQALDDVVSITNSSLLSTVKGNIDLPYWRSRKTYVSSVSGSIKGDYALLDLLSVSSQSGSVRIGVDPQHADKQHPKPAWLKTKTVSGSIDIGLITRSDTPDRDYKTLVTSMSGSIKGTFLLGTEASFETASGSMQLAIHPHEIGQKHPRLSTKTHSGQTTVEIVEPYVSEFYLRSRAEADRLAAQANGMFDSGMLSSLDSSHSTSSASINLKYPDEWTGRIAAQSVSGSIKLKGEGVHVDVAQEIPGFKKTLAHKGFGSGLTDIRSVSGSIDFLAGFVD